jgi:DNA-binding MarR family transcriptional regulator
MKRNNKSRGVADRLAQECLGVRLRMLHRAVSRIYDDAFRPHGVRAGQTTILIAVAYGGSLKPSDLCRVLHMEKSTLSRDVTVLQRQGWLEVEPDEQGRGQILRVSKAGLALLEDILPAWEDAQRHVSALLGESGVNALHETARKLGFPACRR